MSDPLNPALWGELYNLILSWVQAEVLTLASLVQGLTLLVLAILARASAKPLRPRLEARLEGLRVYSPLRRALSVIDDQLFGIVFVLLLWLTIGIVIQIQASIASDLLRIFASLISAWILIKISSSLIANPFIANLFAALAWTIAALNIVGLLGPAIDALDSVTLPLGQTRITLLTIINGAILLGILMWSALAVSRFIESRLAQVAAITPRARVLIGKTIRFVMIVVAVTVALSSVGINFAALAVFTGAVGVGIGIGLQKQVSNLISGVILLLDKSIKPGDIIEVGSTFGWVNTMSARYVGVTTRDNKELLIPNDDFVTNQVINWSHSDNDVRMEVSFGVTYDCDPHEVRKLAVEAAAKPERIVDNRPPICHLVEFGDSSLNFVLRFWIRDPAKGVTNVKGEVLLALWDGLKTAGIEIPYPQRVIQIQNDNAKG
ncbi:MAG: mechanosensitive ion channel [Rhodospirillaceae bacterium]|nr:mechanosensitive ion channel [Rhodospirillaceae bacterium]